MSEVKKESGKESCRASKSGIAGQREKPSGQSRSHPVHDRVGMAEGHPLEEHKHVAFDLGLTERLFRIADHFRQVRVHILKH